MQDMRGKLKAPVGFPSPSRRQNLPAAGEPVHQHRERQTPKRSGSDERRAQPAHREGGRARAAKSAVFSRATCARAGREKRRGLSRQGALGLR